MCVLRAVGLDSPVFADGTHTLTLSLLSGGYLTSQVTTDYTLTIHADFNVTQKGWSDIGTIAVTTSTDKVFSTDKKVVVTASSANSFKMASGTAEIGYILKTAESDSSATTEFTFSAEDTNSGTASQDLGISITWDSNQASGKYTDTIMYTGEVKDAITWNEVNISVLSDYTAEDGNLLTGIAPSNAHINIANGASIKLKDANITSISDTNLWAGITCAGDATIILEGTNTVNGGYEEYPGIFVGEGYTLSIKGDGLLTASSNGWAPDIGGSDQASCGDIIITSGVTSVTATAGSGAQSIGAGYKGTCGTVTIEDESLVSQN